MEQNIKMGIYKHFKGGQVFVFSTAVSSDGEEMVLYKGLENGKIYARPLSSFLDLVQDAKGNLVSRFSVMYETKTDIHKFLLDEQIKLADEINFGAKK